MPFRYRKFKVYQDAISFHGKVVRLTKNFPIDFKHLTDQMKRATLSIVLNIAEGSAKSSDKDFGRFIGMSLGSTDEVVAGFEVAMTEKLVNLEQFTQIEMDALEISNQLGGLLKKLRS